MRWWVTTIMQCWKLARTWNRILLARSVISCSASIQKRSSGTARRRVAAFPALVMATLHALSARRCICSVASKKWSTNSRTTSIVWISRQCSGVSFTRECISSMLPPASHVLYSNSFGAPPSYRDFHTATVIFDRMYIFGGRGDVQSPYHSQEEIYCPQIVYLDLRTHHWVMPTTTNKQPVGRRSHSACKSLSHVLACSPRIITEHHVTLHKCRFKNRKLAAISFCLLLAAGRKRCAHVIGAFKLAGNALVKQNALWTRAKAMKWAVLVVFTFVANYKLCGSD